MTSAMTLGPVVAKASLSHYFHGLVTEALSTSRLDVSAETEHYLVQLLSGFPMQMARKEAGESLQTTPLAFLLKGALEAPPAERMRRLRDLGDVALYTGGFFRDSLKRRTVTLRYYVQMGGGAYSSLADMLSQCTSGRAFGGMYSELAEHFGDLVGVLNDIADSQTFDRDEDALRLYASWLKSRSERLYRRLVLRGLVPALGVSSGALPD